MNPKRLLSIIGPGVLVAATGVGAGDLATASLTGSRLGVAILWAVWIGALLKFVLNEGLARWQLATGDTFLEGCARHFGRGVHYLFLAYLVVWTFFVGAALMSACGVTAYAIAARSGLDTVGEVFRFDAGQGKIGFGIVQSLLGLLLVRLGGFRLFERVMSVCIGLMFLTVIVTAVTIGSDWRAIGLGLAVPLIPDASGAGLSWTVALMGGVGGTVTILCYGYWIREDGRIGVEHLNDCRIDLAAGYLMTAVFGLAMVIIGSTIQVDGKGAGLIVTIAESLQGPMGTFGVWAFLLGAWAAVFSSLLGVWQSVPYLFADCLHLAGGSEQPRDTAVHAKSPVYQKCLFGIATIPAIGLFYGFAQMQKIYAIVGAGFMPMLALALLLLNGNPRRIGEFHRNRMLTTVTLGAILVFFVVAGWFEVQSKLGTN